MVSNFSVPPDNALIESLAISKIFIATMDIMDSLYRSETAAVNIVPSRLNIADASKSLSSLFRLLSNSLSCFFFSSDNCALFVKDFLSLLIRALEGGEGLSDTSASDIVGWVSEFVILVVPELVFVLLLFALDFAFVKVSKRLGGVTSLDDLGVGLFLLLERTWFGFSLLVVFLGLERVLDPVNSGAPQTGQNLISSSACEPHSLQIITKQPPLSSNFYRL